MSAPLTLPTEGHIRIGPGEPRTEPESVGSVRGVREGLHIGAPPPGLYPGVPFAEYLRWPAISASLLKTYLGRSPLHARHEQLRGRDSVEMAQGRAAHAAILEPEVYARTYVARWRATGKDSRKTINPARIAAVAAAGQIELDDEDREAVEAMRDAVLAHPIAGELVRQALARELSATWTDPETGAPCKARLDLLALHEGRVVVPDIKTCRDASWRAFQKDIQTYHYATQASWYLGGLSALEPGPERGWLWIAVESEAPHGVAVYEPDEDLLQRGWDARARALALHLECTRTGRWPGYPETVQTITAPRWAQ